MSWTPWGRHAGRRATISGTMVILAMTMSLAGGSWAAASPAASRSAPTSAAQAAQQAAAADFAQYVNPYVGTAPGAADQGTGGGAGNNFPGADVPFGMVQWSPDTVSLQHGGYYYPDNRIRGFSLTHLSGAGCDTYEDIPFMPVVGGVTDSPAVDPSKYVATFTHSNETVSPGYYGVTLDNGAKVDLTVTQRTGFGQFSYPAGHTATLLVNTSGSISGTSDSQVSIGTNSISGWADSGNFCGTGDHYRVYFFAQFDSPFASIGTWHNGAVTPGNAVQRGGEPASPAVVKAEQQPSQSPTAGFAAQSRSAAPTDVTASGPGTGGFVTFDTTKKQTIGVRVGLSFVSVDGARTNLTAENNGGRSFAQVASAARAAWNGRLGEVAVSGGTLAQRRTFYTNLYHSLLQPNVFSDADGSYPGFDGRIHTAARGHAMYTNFSGWDIYRSETQLLALLAPGVMSDIANSMATYAQQGGSWDRWTVANDYTGVMNGDPYHIIVSTAYAFGATNFDANAALQSMIRGATQPTTGYVERPGLADYLKLGYVPNAAADTLEYTSADFAIAQLASRLGDAATYDTFTKRSQYWQNLYNPATGYLQPRNADGSFSAGFDPASPSGYVEGNGAQYTWMVPYDEAGLINALGGDQAVNQRLNTFFSQLNAGPRQPYAFLSNEPTLETPWLYDFTGAPYQTQATNRRVQTQLYNDTPAGLQGNDDLGEMGSWYVWSAIGLYPEIPGRAELVVGSPLFPQVRITTPTGKRFTINAPAADTSTQYVSGLKVDGQVSTRPWLPESFVHDGGTLDFTMAATPDTSWGAAPADAPPSFRDGEAAAVPSISPARLVIPPGGSAQASVGVQDLSGAGLTASWSAQPPAGVTLSPASGTLNVPSGQKGAVPVTVSVASGTGYGTYRIPITVTVPGQALPAGTLVVLAAQPGGLFAAFNNIGVSANNNSGVADYDGDGFAYSADALAAAGVTPGSTITVNGLNYTWPAAAVGEQDNVIAGGQTIDLPAAPAGATRLGLLGSATNGDTSGTLTITYTDGSTETATIGFSDWTLAADGESAAYGNQIAVKTGYRNAVSGTPQQIDTYLFSTAPIALTAGKQVASITLPASTTGNGELHVFAIAVG